MRRAAALLCAMWLGALARPAPAETALLCPHRVRQNTSYRGVVYGHLKNAGGPRLLSGITRADIWEEHHTIYGSGWALGRDTLDYFRRHVGLHPHHTFLDCGCGTGRNGVRIARVLRPHRYYGFDKDPVAIATFLNYEIPVNDLEDRNVTLNVNAQFDTAWPGVQFDRMLAYSVISHVSDPRKAICHMARALKDGGVMVITHQKWGMHAKACGLKMTRCDTVPSKFYNSTRLCCQYTKTARA